MDITLGQNDYGKAGIRLAYVWRDGDRHDFRDLTVSVALEGDFAASFMHGDNTKVLPTDSQKNTVYALAKERGVGEIEDFATLLARHFVESHGPVERATVRIEEHGWTRIGPHSFGGDGGLRYARARHRDGATTEIRSGLLEVRVVNTTGSEFAGFATDRYTTLPEAWNRILATRITALWIYGSRAPGNNRPPEHPPSRAEGNDPRLEPPQTPGEESGRFDWATIYTETRRHLVQAFVETYSRSLQQTLYAMGARVLEHRPEIAAIRLSLPNIHHTPVDLSPFGLTNENEVFVVSEQPHGLIEGTVTRSAPDTATATFGQAQDLPPAGDEADDGGWGW
jgi:urate oxidase